MGRLLVVCGSLALLGCPKDPDPDATAGASTGAVTTTGTSAGAVTTSGTTTQASTGASTGTGPAATTTSGTTTGTGSTTGACENGFIGTCGSGCSGGELCVNFEGHTGSEECQPNPGGCVPSDPCSPECAVFCGAGKLCTNRCDVLVCSEAVACEIAWDGWCLGNKCVPYDAFGDGTWSGTKCVPIDPNPGAPGEPCTTQGDEKSGIDSCERDSICRDGVCVEMCNIYDEGCDAPDTICVPYTYSIYMICRPTCDPLANDCVDGEVCAVMKDLGFACVVDASGDEGQYGDECIYINGCDPGLTCAYAEEVPNCTGDQCCTPLCDTSQPNTCPGAPEQQCEPWYDSLPPGYETLGYCGVP